MAKGWTKISTINDRINKYDDSKENRDKRDNSFNLLIRNTKTLSAEKIKENSEILYIKQQFENAKLLDAFEHNLVKSKTAIKRAIRLKKEQTEKEKKEV